MWSKPHSPTGEDRQRAAEAAFDVSRGAMLRAFRSEARGDF
jgi:hypothetical protein